MIKLKIALQSKILTLFTITVIFYFIFIDSFFFMILTLIVVLLIKKYNLFYILVSFIFIFFITTYLNFYISSTEIPVAKEHSDIEICVDKNLSEDPFTSFESNYEGQLFLFTTFTPIDLVYGDCIKFHDVEISELQPTFYNSHSFDYSEYMMSKSIRYQIMSDEVTFLDYKEHSIINFIKNFRDDLIATLTNKYPKNANMINSIVLGKSEFHEDFELSLEKSGLLHIFSISGTHIIILLEIFALLTKRLKLKIDSRNTITFVLITILYLMGGMKIPLARAAFAEICFLLFSQNIKKLHFSRLYFIICFLLKPTLLYNPSYQLTFLSTELVYSFRDDKLLFPLYMFFFMLPLTLNISFTFNIVAPLFGFILEFLICSVLLPLGIIMIILPILPLLGVAFYLINSFVHISITILSDFSITSGYISSIIIAFFIISFHIENTKLKYFSCIVLLIISCQNYNFLGFVSFLDVGQGDSTLIQFPFNGEVILIDTGDQSAQEELVNELKGMGISKIDHLILTHDHSDHNFNVNALEDNFKIKNTYTSYFDQHDDIYKNETRLKAGDHVKLETQNIDVLYPYCENDNQNSESLTFTISLAGQTLFFGGDIEKADEEIIINDNPELDVDYLKVNHHGSTTSTSQQFIDTTTPSYAIISSGRNNSYNHPAPETIELLSNENITIYETQKEGKITFLFSKNNFWRLI